VPEAQFACREVTLALALCTAALTFEYIPVTCDDDCNGRGVCEPSSPITNGGGALYPNADPSKTSYLLLDESRVYSCRCDVGWTGSTCQYRTSNLLLSTSVALPLSRELEWWYDWQLTFLWSVVVVCGCGLWLWSVVVVVVVVVVPYPSQAYVRVGITL
jgi:hypothetical protein